MKICLLTTQRALLLYIVMVVFFSFIRTSYDATTKKYWLSIYRRKLTATFLMKDYGKRVGTKVQDAALSEKRIIRAINQMITSVNE
jgi:hypothetical protein